MKKTIILILSLIITMSCETEEPYFSCENNNKNIRVGALCKNGQRVSTTGSGTCSRKGGVKQWICN